MVKVPSISVIIPSHNAANFLPDAVNSVFAQNYPQLEIILVDDNSNDETPHLASQWGKSLRYFRSNYGSPAAARNSGLQLSRTDYVGFLDADDMWTPDHLQAQLVFHTLHPELDFSHGYTRKIYLDSFDPSRMHIPRDDAPHLNPNPGSMLFRRDSLLRLGGFDESLRFGEDIDLWLRCRTSGLIGAVFEKVVLQYRMHAGNMTNFQNDNQHDLLVVLSKSVVRQGRRPQLSVPSARLPHLSDDSRHFPLVSIIITCKSGISIDETLQSIARQHYPSLEIFVIAEKPPNIELSIFDQANCPLRGLTFISFDGPSQADAINLGLRAFNGEYIACIRAGDVWSQDRLHNQVGIFLYNPKVGLLLGEIRLVIDPIKYQYLSTAGFSIAPWDSLGAALIRREAIDLVGELDTSFQDGATAEWLSRFSGGLAGEKFPLIFRIPRVVLYQPIENCSHLDLQTLSHVNITRILHKAIQRRKGRQS